MAEYNDNIFLEPGPHDAVSALVIAPSIKVLAREKNWDTYIDTRLVNSNYSDDRLDRTPRYFDITGNYFSARDTFSLNGSYDLSSSLSTESSDFGITQQHVDRKLLSFAPQYTRSFSERLALVLSYSHTYVDYSDTVNTGFVEYVTDQASGSFMYNLTELDRLFFTIQTVDYESKDKQFEYQVIDSSVGMTHKFSESFTLDYSVGFSRRDSNSRSTQTFTFFGQPITRTQTVDFTNNGVVFEAGFEKSWEASSLSGRISRNSTTDSFGGLNEINNIQLTFNKKSTALLKYSIRADYKDVESVSSGNRFSDRKVMYFSPGLDYHLSRDWNIHASYSYSQREFKANNIDDRAPHLNKVSVGMTYNFPPISTF